jgi:phosphatidyl-myo-inositol dimannoside synthase
VPVRPLFLTRKFPPSVGGMETLAAGVWRALHDSEREARLIAHGGPNSALTWWFPVAIARLVWALARKRTDLVLTGDALTYAVARPVLRAFRVPNATMVMGLDMTYDNRLYQAIVGRALRAAPAVLANSTATAGRAVEAGVARERITVVRLGVDVPAVSAHDRSAARTSLMRDLSLPPDALVLITIGRLVRRKGVRWFVAEVLPQLPARVHYIVAGEGPEQAAIEHAAAAAGVSDRVRLLGRVGDRERETLLCGADIFVQPNVPVAGDMEGFGLVVVEAAVRGTVTVASALEGITDAVVDGETGILVPPEDPAAWIDRLTDLTATPEALAGLGRRFAVAAADRYGAPAMASDLRRALGLAPA